MGWSRTNQVPWTQRVETLARGSNIDVICRLRENKHPQFGGFELDLVDLRT